MKKSLRWLLLLGCLLYAGMLQAAQGPPPTLAAQLCAGVSITASFGLPLGYPVYSIEYVTDLTRTNDSNAWRCLEFVQPATSPYLWIDRSGPVNGRRFYRAVEFKGPTNMVFIPPGTFRMGSPADEDGRMLSEGPQTAVAITRAFWMGKYEITQGEYAGLMGSNPSHFSPNFGFADDPRRPVENVSWFDATNYCYALTIRERSQGRIPANTAYRLPTDAEWEYACRAGTSDRRFFYGDDPTWSNITNYAWVNVGASQPVGQKRPNPWGLFDVYGNVDEWCQDWFEYFLPGGIVVDPQGPLAGSERVFRGGDWLGTPPPPFICRSAYRNSASPTTKADLLGFRVVLVPSQP